MDGELGMRQMETRVSVEQVKQPYTAPVLAAMGSLIRVVADDAPAMSPSMSDDDV
jgi:hypothetical protein